MDLIAFEQQIIDHEGEKFKPYTDTAGKITIGVGRNLTDRGISLQESRLLLQNDVAETMNELDAQMPWWRGMDEIRQRVVADMCFNLGVGTLLTFTTFLHLVRTGQYDAAAADMATTEWYRQVGIRGVHLRQMMASGEFVPLSSISNV